MSTSARRRAEARAPADALVLFGASGDLARKKLFPALYHLAARDRLGVPVVGVASSAWNDQAVRDHAHAAVAEAVSPVDEGAFASLAGQLGWCGGDYRDSSTYEGLASRLSGCHHPLFYLAVPPSLFGEVVAGLVRAGIAEGGRVVVEKPFGRDLKSAQELNALLHDAFPEESIFRIDHYLGKESVESLLVFRFANSLLEPVWDRRYVASVQVTMAESFGVEGRGPFYESVGAIRDVVQNHLLQVVTFLAMEPPVRADADALRDEKAKVLKAMRAVRPAEVVRGQFAGYRDEPGVDRGSSVETFAALRLEIESWRWAGVPFFIRTGKKLATTALEAVVEFRAPPKMLFAGDGGHQAHPNHLIFRLGHDDGITLGLQTKEPGEKLTTRPVALDVSYERVFGERQDPYERLLEDAMSGSASRFAREDAVEEAWRVVDPVIRRPGPVHPYDPGSWGPAEADRMVSRYGGWHDPRALDG